MLQNSTPLSTSTPSRKIVTVLFADIVGYTRLMEKDEADALLKLNFFKEKLENRIALNSGQLIQYYGDAALVIFQNPEQAMTCAMHLQQDTQTHTSVPLRMGLHTGEVVFKDNNVFGDTVNIASRLESMGKTGTVLCSEKVKNKIGENDVFKFTDLGKFILKNVGQPIKVFALSNEGFTIPTKNEIDKKIAQPDSKKNRPIFKWVLAGLSAMFLLSIGFFLNKNHFNNNIIASSAKASSGKSIAVLPFANLSADQNNRYFCDGMMEDILNRLSSVKNLRVMSRTSVLRYRDTEKSIPEVAKELGVSHVLEGSIRRIDDKIRVIVNLVQAKTESRVWSESYDRVVNDIFGIQSEIAESIGEGLELTFLPKESLLVDYKPTQNTEAYDLFLKGRNQLHVYQEHRKEEDLEMAFQYFSEAVAIDDELAIAWAYLGNIQILRHTFFGAPSIVIDSAFISLQKAITLHPELSEGYLFRSNYHELKKQLPQMEADLKQALGLAPNSVDALRLIGSYYVKKTKEDYKAIPYFKKAITLEPFNVRPLVSLSTLNKLVGNLEKSKYYLDQATKIEPDRLSNYMRLADINMLLGDFTAAQKSAQRILEINPEFIWGKHILAETYAFNGEHEAAEKYYRAIQDIVMEEGFVESFGTPPFRHRLGFVLWNMGEKEEAEKLFQQMIDRSLSIVNSDIDNLGGARYDLAAVYAFLGKKEESIKWMERIFKDSSWFDYYYTQLDPLFDPIRDDKEFQAIMNREKDKINKMSKKVEQMENADFVN